MVSFLALLLLRVVSLDRRPEWLSCYATSFNASSPSFEPPTSRFLIIFFPFPVALQRSNSLNCCAVAQHLALDLRSSCFDDRALGFSIFFLLLQGVRLATPSVPPPYLLQRRGIPGLCPDIFAQISCFVYSATCRCIAGGGASRTRTFVPILVNTWCGCTCVLLFLLLLGARCSFGDHVGS